MGEVFNRDSSHDDTPAQERVFARLQPESELEEQVAQRIAQCYDMLDHMRNRLTKTWSQLNKAQEALRHDPLL